MWRGVTVPGCGLRRWQFWRSDMQGSRGLPGPSGQGVRFAKPQRSGRTKPQRVDSRSARRSSCSLLFAVEPRGLDRGLGFLLPFVGNGVLFNQSIERIQKLASPAVVVSLVHILS